MEGDNIAGRGISGSCWVLVGPDPARRWSWFFSPLVPEVPRGSVPDPDTAPSVS